MTYVSLALRSTHKAVLILCHIFQVVSSLPLISAHYLDATRGCGRRNVLVLTVPTLLATPVPKYLPLFMS